MSDYFTDTQDELITITLPSFYFAAVLQCTSFHSNFCGSGIKVDACMPYYSYFHMDLVISVSVYNEWNTWIELNSCSTIIVSKYATRLYKQNSWQCLAYGKKLFGLACWILFFSFYLLIFSISRPTMQCKCINT